jgi:hypothetical protein
MIFLLFPVPSASLSAKPVVVAQVNIWDFPVGAGVPTLDDSMGLGAWGADEDFSPDQSIDLLARNFHPTLVYLQKREGVASWARPLKAAAQDRLLVFRQGQIHFSCSLCISK